MTNKCVLKPTSPNELQLWVRLFNENEKRNPTIDIRPIVKEMFEMINSIEFIRWFGDWERGFKKEGRVMFDKLPSVEDIMYYYDNRDTINDEMVLFSPNNDLKEFTIASQLLHSNYQFKIAGISKYISNLYDEVRNEKNPATRARLMNEIEDLKNKKKALIDEIPATDTEYQLINIITEAVSDLDEAERLLKNGKYSYEYVNQLIKFWLNISTLEANKNKFFTKDQLENDAVSIPMTSIHSKALTLQNIMNRQNEVKLQDFVKRQTGVFESISDLMKAIKDISIIPAKVLDISRLGDNKIVGAIYNAVKMMRTKARKEAIKIANMIDDFSIGAERKLKELGLDQSIFFAKDKNGQFKGTLTHYFNDAYYKWSKEIRKAKNWTEYENKTVVINPNYFDDIDEDFPDHLKENTGEDKQAIYNKLLKIVGNKHILDRELASAKKRIQTYIDKRSLEWFELSNNDKLDDAGRERLLNKWVNENSPYKKQSQKNKDKTSQAYSYMHRIPKREVNGISTGFYSKEYETILNHKELSDYFNFIQTQMRQLKYMLPYEERDHSDRYSIPFLEKSFMENFKDSPGSDVLYDQWIKTFTSPTPKTEIGTQINLATNAITKNLSGKTLTVNQMVEIRLKQLEKEHKILHPLYDPDTVTSDIPIYNKLKQQATQYVIGKQSLDLSQITKILALNAMMYKYKAKVETDVRIATDQFALIPALNVNNFNEPYKTFGTEAPSDKGLMYFTEALNFFLDKTFYETGQKKEAVSKNKVLSSEEKQDKAKFEGLLNQIEKYKSDSLKQLEKDKSKLTKQQYEQRKTLIEGKYQNDKSYVDAELENLGSNVTGSKIGNFALKYMQFLTMGWNAAAGVANVMFGKVSNYVHSGDERSYSQKSLARAEGILIKSLGDKDLRTKITKLMKEMDVLKKSSEELFKTHTGNFLKSIGMTALSRKLKYVSPYAIQNGGEYMNQAPIMLAMMMDKEIEDGVSLWDALDESGNFKKEYKHLEEQWTDSENANEFDRFKLALDQKLDMIHGNYDEDKAIQITETFVGRSVSQFRKWMFEGFAVRFEVEHFDPALGYKVKGHYRSMKDIFADPNLAKGAGQNAKLLMTLFNTAYKLKFGKMTMDEAQTSTGITELDLIGLRKMINELEVMIATTLLLLLLGKGEDDDDDEIYLINFIYNEGLRLKTDLLFYINPTEFMNLVQNPTILFGFYEKLAKFTGDVYDIIFGDKEDQLQSGPFEGMSRTMRSIFDMIPGTANYNKMIRMIYKQRE